jgi:hypothetical protein
VSGATLQQKQKQKQKPLSRSFIASAFLLLYMGHVWKVSSGDLLTKEAMGEKYLLYTKKYVLA